MDEITLTEPDLMTFAINRYWPEIDMEWFVVPQIAANDWTDDVEAPRCKECGDYHFGPCPTSPDSASMNEGKT